MIFSKYLQSIFNGFQPFSAQGVREGIRLNEETYNAVFKPIENRRAFQVLPLLLHPRSKGYLKLKSRNPFHRPLLYPNFFADSRDIDTLLEGIRETIKIVEQPEFQKLGVKLYNATVPGCTQTEFNSDEYWRCYIRHLSATLHHQIGTCKMGPRSDNTSVVDANGRVHGVKNLRVADISIIPEPPSGHTAALSFLIGEKISDSIRNDWKPKESNIQKLTRIRKSVDWLYQDPEHTTEMRPSITTTTKRRLLDQQFITIKPTPPTSMQMMHVLHALNVSGWHEHSQQFKNSTIGDVGVILWGTLTSSKTIDFKSKLAEHHAHTGNESAATNETSKTRILKPTKLPPVEKRIASSTNAANPSYTSLNDTEITTVATSSEDNFSGETASTQSSEPSEQTTTEQSSGLSNMDRIMATAPSLDEDSIKTYEHRENEKPNTSKAKYITKRLKLTNSTSFVDANSKEEPLPAIEMMTVSTTVASNLSESNKNETKNYETQKFHTS